MRLGQLPNRIGYAGNGIEIGQVGVYYKAIDLQIQALDVFTNRVVVRTVIFECRSVAECRRKRPAM